VKIFELCLAIKNKTWLKRPLSIYSFVFLSGRKWSNMGIGENALKRRGFGVEK